MTDRIFETYAPLYWQSGLPVIPLRQRNKMPDIMNWSLYGRQMPTVLEQQHWLASYPEGNIGLPLGPESGVCIIDIDTEDAELDAAIREICGPTPWVRVGKKGAALAYRFEGQKNFKLRGAGGGMLCEFLGMGNQVVVPPSIHPETQMPYTASADLCDVLDQLPFLGEDIEDKLRALLGTKGFKIAAGGRSSPVDIVPAGERDVQMVRHAGYLARVVLGIDRSAQFSLVEAMGHMYHWVETFTAKITGDEIDPQMGVTKLLEFLLRDVRNGRSLPRGWGAGLTEQMLENPTVQELRQLNADGRWTVSRARTWFDDCVRSNVDDIDHLIGSLEEITRLVAKDDQFTDANALALYAYLHDRYFKKENITKRDMTTGLTQARKDLQDHETENQWFIAVRVLEDLQRTGEIRFDHGQFWQWNGSCFSKVDEDALYKHVAENVKDSVLVRRNSDYKAIVEVLEKMCKIPLVQCDARGINFANGFVLEDLDVADHDPKYGATFTLPFEYHRDSATRCPRFMEFLHSCWGSEVDFQERVDALQEAFAVTLLKLAPAYQRAFLLFGRAGTGKTVLLKILRSMLPPDAIAELGPQHWGERFGLTDLIGKAANICGELPENGMITGNRFKEIVEGSPIRTEFKGQDGFTFIPECANWFASNYLPVSRDSTLGFIRRWLILDFNCPVLEGDQIKDLDRIIVAEEREAIAAWALEGASRLLSNCGLTLPPSHHNRIHQMRRINNSVQAFLDDAGNIRVIESGQIKARALYDLYGFHVREVGRGRPVPFEPFMQMLEDLDLDVERDLLGDFIVKGVEKAERREAA